MTDDLQKAHRELTERVARLEQQMRLLIPDGDKPANASAVPKPKIIPSEKRKQMKQRENS